eukprot:168948_1
MAVRDLTAKFLDLRKRLRQPKIFSASVEDNWQENLLANDSSARDHSLQPTHSLPPVWVDIVDRIKEDISSVEKQLNELQSLHDSRLRVKFDEEKELELDRRIEILTQNITQVFRTNERQLKRIATVSSETGANLAYQERVVRLNVMRALASTMQTHSKRFRKAQKDFLMQLQRQEGMGGLIPDDDDSAPISLDDIGWSNEQEMKMKEMTSRVKEREKEIILIAKSINELAEVFKELSVLVIEQGTILDRIDYNVEQALCQVKSGVKEVETAERYQKKRRTTMIILCLIISIMLCCVIVVWRNSS